MSFAKRYCAAEKNDHGWVTDGAINLDELALQLHASMLRRRKEDVLDLRPKTRTLVDVEINADTAAAEIREVFATLVASRADDRPESRRHRLLAKITKARKNRPYQGTVLPGPCGVDRGPGQESDRLFLLRRAHQGVEPTFWRICPDPHGQHPYRKTAGAGGSIQRCDHRLP